MNNRIGPYQVVDIPPARRVLISFLDLNAWRHAMFGLLEVDVTAARQWLAKHEARTAEKLSFTGYLVFCLGQAIDEDKSVQAYLKGRKQLVVFDDVDVGLMIEHRFGETRAPTGHVIRRANQKTFMEIHQEIRRLQGEPPARKDIPSWLRSLMLLPGPVRRPFVALVKAVMRQDPAGKWVAMAGTVGVTSIGMFGEGAGWGLAAPDGHTLSLVVGGIARKPAVVGDRIEPRELLSLTVIFDHDVVDGAPAARFTHRLKDLIENAYGLDANETEVCASDYRPQLQAVLR